MLIPYKREWTWKENLLTLFQLIFPPHPTYQGDEVRLKQRNSD